MFEIWNKQGCCPNLAVCLKIPDLTLYDTQIRSWNGPKTYKRDNAAGFTGVYLLDFFCSGIQFYLLLSPYLCFISLLYFDLYALGDDALIS